MKYAAMAAALTRTAHLEKLSPEERNAAMHAANAFRLVEDFLEHNAPCVVELEVLVQAEETYKRQIEDAS